MIHEMRLDPKPFELIKSGKKTVELRLYDEKRQRLNKGDDIIFINNADENEKIAVTVKELHIYTSFSELFTVIDPKLCGYAPDTTVDTAIKEMRKYYSEELESSYGVIGIKISKTKLELMQKQLGKELEQPNKFEYKAIENIANCFKKHKIDYLFIKKEYEDEIITEISVPDGPNILLHYYCYRRDHDVTMTATLITRIPDDKRAAILEACNDINLGFCPFTLYIDFDNNLRMNYEFLFAFTEESIGKIAYELKELASTILYLLFPELVKALYDENYKSAGLDETLRSIRAEVKKMREKRPD